MRDQARGFVARHPGAAGVLIFIEIEELKKSQARREWEDSTPARPDGWRTRSSWSAPPTPQRMGMRWSTGTRPCASWTPGWNPRLGPGGEGLRSTGEAASCARSSSSAESPTNLRLRHRPRLPKRHTALAAYALSAVASTLAKAPHLAPFLPDDADQKAPADCGMTALTVPESQHLLTVITRLHGYTANTIGPGPRVPPGLIRLATKPPGPSRWHH